MARPTKFTPERGRAVLSTVSGLGTRAEAAEVAGIGLSTLGDWIARGRAGDPAFVGWLAELHEAARRARRIRWLADRGRERAYEKTVARLEAEGLRINHTT